MAEAFINGAKIVVAPELATSGYCITKEDIFSNLGIEEPFDKLSLIRDLACLHKGYAFIGLPEIEGELEYNTVVIFGANGYVGKQRKRGLAGWNERGNLPYDVFKTEYGDLSPIICSDSYLPDFTRISAINAGDVLIAPANWWGDSTQLDIWKTNAHDNNMWVIVSNRWGIEIDDRYETPYVYDMNDAPSAIISPFGKVLFSYKTNDDNKQENQIFYHTIQVPNARISSTQTSSYSLLNREPSAYQAIGNDTYISNDYHNSLFSLISRLKHKYLNYKVDSNFRENFMQIKAFYKKIDNNVDVLLVPAFGLGKQKYNIDNTEFTSDKELQDLQQFLKINDIKLIVSTVNIIKNNKDKLGVLIINKNGQITINEYNNDDTLPTAGELNYSGFAYIPENSLNENLILIDNIFKNEVLIPNIITLPALGIGNQVYNLDEINLAEELSELQEFVNSNNIEILTLI